MSDQEATTKRERRRVLFNHLGDLFGFGQILIGVYCLALFIIELGWAYLPKDLDSLWRLTNPALGAFAMLELGRFLLADDKRAYLKLNRLILVLVGLCLLFFLGESWLILRLGNDLAVLGLKQTVLMIVAGSQLLLIGGVFLRTIRAAKAFWTVKLSPGTLAILSFLLVITIGTFLLKTPEASNGVTVTWIDALFTATSAVCVTGLTVVDTATVWSTKGHLIILALMQTGGLGVLTLTYLLAVIGGESVSLRDRVMLQELLKEDNLGKVSNALIAIILTTLFIELVGAIGLYFAWQDYPVEGDIVWLALFHSVSAFCNAGFSLFPGNLADEWVRNNISGQVIISGLVILGGMGFIVLRNTSRYFMGRARLGWSPYEGSLQRNERLLLHSKVAWLVTAVLIVTGTVLLSITEISSTTAAGGQWVWQALFDSLTARTAGFNISDISSYSVSTTILLIILMFIGGCPGGTAGGVKTTVVAIAFLNLRRVFSGKPHIEMFNRRLPEHLSNLAFAIILMAIIWILGLTMIISLLHPELDYMDILFESTSAFATTGLSRGITSDLGALAKMLVIITMFVGRVGLMLIVATLFKRGREGMLKYPEEAINLT